MLLQNETWTEIFSSLSRSDLDALILSCSQFSSLIQELLSDVCLRWLSSVRLTSSTDNTGEYCIEFERPRDLGESEKVFTYEGRYDTAVALRARRISSCYVEGDC